MICTDSPMRFFVWSKARGSYGTRSGAIAYAVYQGQIYILSHNPAVSMVFDKAEQLLNGGYVEVSSLDRVLPAVNNLFESWARQYWKDAIGDLTEPRLIQKLERLT